MAGKTESALAGEKVISPGLRHPRLPCRGCTDNCSNYSACDGRPWRTLGSASHSEPSRERAE